MNKIYRIDFHNDKVELLAGTSSVSYDSLVVRYYKQRIPLITNEEISFSDINVRFQGTCYAIKQPMDDKGIYYASNLIMIPNNLCRAEIYFEFFSSRYSKCKPLYDSNFGKNHFFDLSQAEKGDRYHFNPYGIIQSKTCYFEYGDSYSSYGCTEIIYDSLERPVMVFTSAQSDAGPSETIEITEYRDVPYRRITINTLSKECWISHVKK